MIFCDPLEFNPDAAYVKKLSENDTSMSCIAEKSFSEVSILAIDTSSSIASTAFYQASGSICIAEGRDKLSHIEDIPRLLGEVLKSGSTPDIAVVGTGPGSFTGLRIGFSFIKGYAQSLGIPVFGLSSLEAAVINEKENARLLISLSDARRKEFFFSAYQVQDGKLHKLGEVIILNYTGIKGKIHCLCKDLELSLNDILVVSDSSDFLSDAGFLDAEIRVVLPENRANGLLKIALLSEKIPIKPYSLAELSSLSPDYVRAVSALTIRERTVSKVHEQ